MDPVAHTLFGAVLAESGLKRCSRYATPTLLIGANLPDVDVIAGLWGSDVELLIRRGHTHGVLAMLLLPLLLVGGVLLWHRWRGSLKPDAPLRAGWLLALAFAAVWSHPLLDWMNTYGVRLLMPFDGRWFYGDTLFIIDPWVWLLCAAGVVLAHSATRRAVAGWLLLAALATALVLGTALVPLAVKAAWCTGVTVLVLLRWRQPIWSRDGSVARTGFALLLAYIAGAYTFGRVAEARAEQRYPAATVVQANPMPGVPFAHRVVLIDGAVYRILLPDGVEHDVPRQEANDVVRAALASTGIRGFVNWMRLPYWTIEESAQHWTVVIRDLRYQGPDMASARGIGLVRVDVPKQAAP